MLLTLIVFILILGLLIIAHEFGHFIVAKLSGIKVLEFAFGFPPTLWKRKKGDTLYLLNLIPIGGYVKMLGEEETVNQPKSYTTKSTLAKIAVSIAGVLMNLVLAWAIMSVGFAVGMSPIISSPDSLNGKILKNRVVVTDVKSDSAAQLAGLVAGDQLMFAVDKDGNRRNFDNADAITRFTADHRGETAELGIVNQGNEKKIEVSLGKEGEQPLGVAVVNDSIVQIPWYRAPITGLIETGKIFGFTFSFVANLIQKIFVSPEVTENVGGPVAIYALTGMAIKLGVMSVMQFIAILSINLALINILPIPALDGGKILFLALRRIFGKYFIKEKVENIIHLVGFILLIGLLILVTIRDVGRFF